MNSLNTKQDDDFKLPKDVPEDFFKLVAKVLDFIEDVDKKKNEQV